MRSQGQPRYAPVRCDWRGNTLDLFPLHMSPTLTEFRLEQTSLRIGGNVRLLTSSQGLGWEELFVAVTEELPHDTFHGAVPAVWLATASTPAEVRRIGVRSEHYRVLPKNAISIAGAGDAAHDEIASPLKVVHVYLRQELVDMVAAEFFKDGGERREIGSSFGLDDAILRQLLVATRHSLNEEPANRLKMDYLSQALAAHLLTKHSVLGPAKATRRVTMFNAREVSLIIDYIAGNLSSNMSIADLAGIVGLGRAQFIARFKATTSMTPHQFVTMKRILKARKLLVEPHVDYAFVAEFCGFASRTYFITTFKRATGMTPNEYRRRMK